MLSETYLDFCFVQEYTGTLADDINTVFQDIFKHERLHWYLDHKQADGAEVVVAEVKGMSKWGSEEDVITHLEANAAETFWNTIQGYQFQVLPLKKGSGACANG